MTRPRVAHYGNPGANTEEAALAIFGSSDTVPCATFAAIFEAVAAGSVEFGVVAVENSQAGSINDTYDLLLTHRETVTIRGEFDLWVHHYLLALPEDELADITVALSHPQALAQTHGFLTKHGIRGEIGGDTAGSARRVRAEGIRGQAAIAGLHAAELYNLRVLAERIEDNPYNFTKFLVLAPAGAPVEPERFALPPVAPGTVKRSLVFSVPNTPGSLYKALGPIATNGLNLTKIESRPARERPWDYYFYADVEGDPADPRYESSIDELREHCIFLNVLGSYHVLSSARAAGWQASVNNAAHG
jgi:prephenate dehydratase